MFGVVPKPLWERQIPPDERNRIPLAMRCLLIEHPDGLVLVDTGAGNKDDAKFRNIYGIENAGARGATQLEDALAETGFAPGDVKLVINTHLHFDHAGGNTLRGEPVGAEHTDQADGFAPDRPLPIAAVPPRLAFPNATYCVQRATSSLPGTPTSEPAPATCHPTSSRWPRPGAGGCSRETGRWWLAFRCESRRAMCHGTRSSWSLTAGRRRRSSATSFPRLLTCPSFTSWGTTSSPCVRSRASAHS